MPLKSASRIAVPLLTLWLLAWIVLSWPAIQDDALIHLRYASFLYRTHVITYDGVHPSYGTSSLLYVGLLALLRSVTASPMLSRAVSTVFHLCLFGAFAVCSLRSLRTASLRVQAFAFSLLLLLGVPSAVRWLDDGMETGLVLCLISLTVLRMHRLSLRQPAVGSGFFLSALLGFSLVILRNELAIVALFASAILALSRAGAPDRGWWQRLLRVLPGNAHFLLGALLAALLIRLVMHSFLPDTALAKSHGPGNFIPTLASSAIVVGGALLFGAGTLLLWLISAGMLLTRPGVRLLPTLAANALFPFVLLASALRGQEVQGVRYLVWTFFFSIVWNLLELSHLDRSSATTTPACAREQTACAATFAIFIAGCLVALPFESRLMFRVLTTRARTMKLMMSQNLAAALPGKLGVASDVGYISFFTGDPICDLAGLVNGRASATLTPQQRATGCAAQHPAFAFLNAGQAAALSQYIDFTGWRVCGVYDFANMRVPDRHFLLVDPPSAGAACRATGYPSAPAATAFVATRYP